MCARPRCGPCWSRMVSSRTEQSYENAQRLFSEAEARSRNVADIERLRLEEMRAKSERLRKLREQRDAIAADKKAEAG
jgi:hypothetical protein